MKKIITFVALFTISSVLLADKPSWAGNGSKPSEYEKEKHKDEMRSKNKERSYEGDSYERKHEEGKTYRGYESSYEGKGKGDGEFIDEKVDETKKNWINKFFDFLN